MDLYLIYNAFCNIFDVCVTPAENISFKHELIANNPLIILHLINNEYLNKQSGGKFKIRIGKGKGKAGAPAVPSPDQAQAMADKAGVPLPPEAKKKMSKMKKLGKGLSAMQSGKLNAGDDEEDTKNMVETLKKILKFCIGFLFLIFIPIVPWFYISFHAFKSLFTLIQLNINTM